MRAQVQQQSHPHYSMELTREECRFDSIDEIVSYLRQCIDADPVAVHIDTFDHLAHTRNLVNGHADESILAARSIIFCFGITLPDPLAMALRPRSIGVVEQPKGFIITFLETPMPIANVAMERWAMALQRAG